MCHILIKSFKIDLISSELLCWIPMTPSLDLDIYYGHFWFEDTNKITMCLEYD